MVEVIPFKGIVYNKEKIKKLDDVMSPPYDIISKEMQDELYKKHPQNFVRLTLGKQNQEDNPENNRYTRARDILKTWLNQSLLISSNTPAIYPYKITYKFKNLKKAKANIIIAPRNMSITPKIIIISLPIFVINFALTIFPDAAPIAINAVTQPKTTGVKFKTC